MAENLQNSASEWEVGESDPSDFTAEAVVEVIKGSDEEEVNRINDADERSTVKNAADSRLKSLSDDDEDDEEESSDTETESMADVDPSDDEYNPYMDPAVGSSSLADVIVAELGSDGKSPTLDECRKAYEDAKED